MKTFDVFLKDEVIGNGFIKDTVVSDVFIKDRLNRIETIITKLIARETINVYDKLLIDCIINELNIFKYIQPEIDLDIKDKIGSITAIVYPLLKSKHIIKADIRFSSKKIISPNCIDLKIKTSEFGIYYLGLIAAGTTLNILTSPIDELTHAKILPVLKSDILLQLKISASAGKVIGGIGKLELVSYISELLEVMVHPASEQIYLYASANIDLCRFTKLNEIDNSTISEMDNLSLTEIDYSDITEKNFTY